MRRRCCVLLAVVLLAGCFGPAGSPTATADASTDSPTATRTPVTSPDTPTPTRSPPPPVTTTVPGPTDADTVDYADLSPEARAAFDAALEDEARFLPDSPAVEGEFHDPDALSAVRQHECVSKDGTTYELSLHDGDLYASYDIYADPTSPDEAATVVAYENLSANVSDEVRWAIENGSHGVPLGKWDSLPQELGDSQSVRYEGETYRLSYAVGDYWVQVLTVEAAA